MDPAEQNQLAIHFKSLHIPGNPVVLGNVYDGATAKIITSLPTVKAVATASYAIAGTEGIDDDDMVGEQNLGGIRKMASVVLKAKLPLTVDLQDGYEDVGHIVRAAIALGAVGCNLEDVDIKTGTLRPVEEAVQRIKLALRAAKSVGVPDFAINARTDVLGYDASLDDAIERGKAYLAAGANTVFVWGGAKGRGVSRQEVEKLVKGLNGRLNVKLNMGPGSLTVPELRKIGVARISVGPELFLAAMKAFKEAACKLLECDG